MAEQPTVLLEACDDQVAVVVLNAEHTGNALRRELLHELRDITRQAVASGARALVLTGAGRDFSLGADKTDLAALAHGSRDTLNEATELLADVISAIHEAPIPTVAAVRGQAAGAGFSLALSCDLRIADESARFNFAYAALGSSPDGGITWLLPRIVGWSRSQELLLEQPVIRARRALAEGMVNEVVPRDDLLPHALRVARLLAGHPAHSMRSVKQLVRRAERTSLAEHMRTENRLFVEGLGTREMRGLLAADGAHDT